MGGDLRALPVVLLFQTGIRYQRQVYPFKNLIKLTDESKNRICFAPLERQEKASALKNLNRLKALTQTSAIQLEEDKTTLMGENKKFSSTT